MAQDKPARDALHTYEIAFSYFHPISCFSSRSRYIFSFSFSLFPFFSVFFFLSLVSLCKCLRMRA